MQPSQEPFFTNNAEGWMKLVAFLVTIIGSGIVSVYVFLRNRWSTDARLRTDIDGVGGRVTILETKSTTHDTEIIHAQEFERMELMQRGFLESRIGALEKSHESIEQAVQHGIDTMTNEVKKIEIIFTRENQELRERVVRLETLSRYGLHEERGSK